MLDERKQIIIALISGQDARKWDPKTLVQWAESVADNMLNRDKVAGENGHD